MLYEGTTIYSGHNPFKWAKHDAEKLAATEDILACQLERKTNAVSSKTQ